MATQPKIKWGRPDKLGIRRVDVGDTRLVIGRSGNGRYRLSVYRDCVPVHKFPEPPYGATFGRCKESAEAFLSCAQTSSAGA